MTSLRSRELAAIKPHPVRVEDVADLPEKFRRVKRRHGVVRGPIHFGRPTQTVAP